ncbi:MAG: hypothetical protein JWR85_3600 [Marmoricola sp.]|nr:hypothetical protein [Marmoricola sp.]
MRSDGAFRIAIGVLAIVGGLASLGLLFFVEVPAGNKEPLLLAIGIVLGWGGAVVQSEYGSTSSGRNLAQTNADIVRATSQSPTGKPNDPVSVTETRS